MSMRCRKFSFLSILICFWTKKINIILNMLHYNNYKIDIVSKKGRVVSKFWEDLDVTYNRIENRIK
jgi:hypothetical protein